MFEQRRLIGLGWLSFVILLLRACPAAAATVDDLPPGSLVQVTRLEIEGADDVSTSAIRKVMVCTPPAWYQPWKLWIDPLRLSPAVLRTDLDRVRTLLRESGHYSAKVSHSLEVEDGKVALTVRLQEGPAAIVSSIEIAATDFALTPDQEARFRSEIPLQPQAAFTQAHYDASHSRIERLLHEGGFAYAEVEKAAVVDTAAHEAQVSYTIQRGEPAVFGDTTVSGLADVDESLIRRELEYLPGDRYDPGSLERTQARLFGLELFRSVAVEASNLAARSGRVDVKIIVVEGPPRSVKLGLGYGSEDEVRGQVQWQHNNFLGGGRQLGIRLKASFIEQSLEGEFRQPYFFRPQQTLVVPLSQGRASEPGFDLLQSRLAPRVERKFGPRLRASIGYNIEYDNLSKVPAETSERLAPLRNRGFVSSWVVGIERNTTEDILDPQDGSVMTIAAEQAGGPWQGDFTFFRVSFEAKRYVPVLWHQVLAGRFRIGTGDGFGQSSDLPLFRRFYAGGIASSRGYERDKVGPLTNNGEPIGGRSLIEGSLEFRTPVYAGFGAVAFADAATVDPRVVSYNLASLRYSVGPGLRYNTPVGPLRIDIGFPLNAPRELPNWQIHFSIGQAF